MKNKFLLTTISFLANFVMAGFATQFGMLVEPIAQHFESNVNQVASLFSFFNGGALAGTIIAFFIIERLGVKRITAVLFLLIALAAGMMATTHSLALLTIAFTLIGISGGVGLCIAGTIVVTVWSGRIKNTMLVIQDATFNVAGVVFPIITTWTLTRHMSWSYSYLAVGAVALFSLLITLITRFDRAIFSRQDTDGKLEHNEWNIGIISAGLGLFASMLALYTFLTWAPVFVQHKFAVPFEQAGTVITQYWSAALVGALVSTAIVGRIRIQQFLLLVMVLATALTTLIVSTHNFAILPYLVFAYGFVCAAVYNSFVAYGVSFVQHASSKNVSYILISGSTGAMFSPAISSLLERIIGLQSVMYGIPVIYALVLVLMLVNAKRARAIRLAHS